MPELPSDARWMAAAARLAARGRPLSRPNPAVGAIIAKGGRVLSRGWTQPGGRPHAEAHALAQIAPGDARGATLYVTLEPCAHASERGPACAGLTAEAGFGRVVIGIEDPDPRTAGNGIERLVAAGAEVVVLDDCSARESLAGYLSLKQRHRPLVTLKLAISQDGFIARPKGGDQWITGEAARAHVHAIRATQDAILVGGGTWRSDMPRLDVRLPGIEGRSPERIILTKGAAPIGATAIASPADIGALEGVQYLYVEGGAATAEAFLEAGLVDRVHLYTAPITVGSGVRAPAEVLAVAAGNARWNCIEQRQLGSDSFAAYSRVS